MFKQVNYNVCMYIYIYILVRTLTYKPFLKRERIFFLTQNNNKKIFKGGGGPKIKNIHWI